ncbi:putative peptidase domain protein [Bordetella holmesii 41130]|nr:putative peptidase domain protein [Bordetella holmesii 41130]
MFNILSRTLLAAGLIGASLGAAAQQPPHQYPLKDFFRNPEKGFFRLADDGKTLGFMQPVSIDGSPPA